MYLHMLYRNILFLSVESPQFWGNSFVGNFPSPDKFLRKKLSIFNENYIGGKLCNFKFNDGRLIPSPCSPVFF